MKTYLKCGIIVLGTALLITYLTGCGGTTGDSAAKTSSGNRITLIASPTIVAVDGNSAIFLKITDSTGKTISQSATVVFSTSLGTLLDPDAVVSEDTVLTATVSKSTSGGTATVLLNSDAAGTAVVSATVAGELLTVQVTFVE